MKRMFRKNHKRNIRKQLKRHLTFLEAIRLYAGMPVGI